MYGDFGVMRFNYKTRRVLQLARRRAPETTPTLPFRQFCSYLRFDSPYLDPSFSTRYPHPYEARSTPVSTTRPSQTTPRNHLEIAVEPPKATAGYRFYFAPASSASFPPPASLLPAPRGGRSLIYRLGLNIRHRECCVSGEAIYP